MAPEPVQRRARAEAADRVVGARIKALRKIRGMTQTELALAVGVSFQQIRKYEKGMNRANPTRLKRIADALGAPFEDFTGDLPPSVRFKATELLAALRLPGAADLVALYAKIEKRSARRKALELLQGLADDHSRTEERRTEPTHAHRRVRPSK
jgi:transcriptional regulator with XRE-family HTH domain